MGLKFEWDQKKAASNLKKHDVSFEEASTVFKDPLATVFDDEEHSQNEDREYVIGNSSFQRLLIVFFTERARDLIRIISARRVTKIERRDYEEKPRW